MVDNKGEKDRKETKAWREKLSALGKKNVGKGSSSGYFPTFRRAGSAAKVAGTAGAGYIAGKAKKAGSTEIKIPSMNIYVVLLVFSLFMLGAKIFVNYQPRISLLLSTATAFVFLIVLHNTDNFKIKAIGIFGVLALDLVIAQGALYYFPTSIEQVFISIHVFGWVGLSLVFLYLFGLSESFKSGRKVPAITWIILAVLIFFLFPLIGQLSYISQKVSHNEYFEIAMEEVEEIGITLDKTTNFWYDYFGCFGNFIAKPDSEFEDCLEDKKIERFCKANFDEDEQKECITVEKKKLSGEGSLAQGAVSDIVKKVFKARLTVPEGLFPKRTAERRRDYPIDLRIENQRELKGITVEASCVFTKRKENISGEISVPGKDSNIFEIIESIDSFRINCKPSTDLELGTYKVNYKVTLHGLSTPSFLKRVIVNKDLSETEIKQIENDYFSSRDDRSSQAPKDLARMNFAFGKPHPTRTGELNPIIKTDEVIPFVTTFENLGNGKIVAVNSYSAETILEMGFRIAKGEYDCLEYGGASIFIPVSRKTVHKNCDLELPDDLKDTTRYELITFKSDFNYDYELDEEESTTIVEAIE